MKANMVKGLSTALAIIVTLAISLVCFGCNKQKDPLYEFSKDELIDMVNEQSTELGAQRTQIEDLQKQVQEAYDGEVPSAAVSEMPDGSTRMAFNSIDGKIYFPIPFQYPGSVQTASTSGLNLTSSISLVPTSNWTIKISGTEIVLCHDSGITGILKAGSIDAMFPKENMQEESFKPFFAAWNASSVTYSRLFLDEDWWGLQAKATGYIGVDKSQFLLGMIGLGDQSLSYTFVFKGEQDAAKEEVILSLLRTVNMMGRQLRVE